MCTNEVELINQIINAQKLLKSIIICDLFSPVHIEVISATQFSLVDSFVQSIYREVLMNLFGISIIFAILCSIHQVDMQNPGVKNVTTVYYNNNEPPKPGQKSLIIAFDGTASMTEDLKQVRIAARDIVNDFASRPQKSIYNYVLVVFRDPYIEDTINTKNPQDIIDILDILILDSRENPDCPELALGGLNKALKYALPFSNAYVFTDASAKDHHLANTTKQLIQSTQTTVNFLTTGDCNNPSSINYKVYADLAGTQGQFFNVPRSDLAEIVSNLKVELDQMFSKVMAIDVGQPGTRDEPFFVDATMSNIRMTLAGKKPKVIIQDPNKNSVVTKDLTLDDLKFVEIKNPFPGKWQITATTDSNYTLRVGAISTVRFDFGFSKTVTSKESETLFQPLKGQKNILSIFVTNPELFKTLTSVTLITNEEKIRRQTTGGEMILKKVKDGIYATEPHLYPDELCSLQLNGEDLQGNVMQRLLSAAILPSEPSMKITSKFDSVFYCHCLL